MPPCARADGFASAEKRPGSEAPRALWLIIGLAYGKRGAAAAAACAGTASTNNQVKNVRISKATQSVYRTPLVALLDRDSRVADAEHEVANGHQ